MCRLSVTVRKSMRALLPNRGVKIIVLLTLTIAVYTHTLTINKLGHPDIVDCICTSSALFLFGRSAIPVWETGICTSSALTDYQIPTLDPYISKTRVELRPITVNAFLYDIVRISAPVINTKAVYYIHKPNGDAMKLDISSPKLRHIDMEQDVRSIITKFIKNMKPIVNQEDNYSVFSIDLFNAKLKNMEANDFMIGPLFEEDHGNWVLSVYMTDFNDDWVELFQVISVTITEYVPLSVSKVTPNSSVNLDIDSTPRINFGETLNVKMAVPIPDLESCELVAPRSTFDRFYDRTRIDMSSCGFSLPNITEQDEGIWKILAVGKMVHEGVMILNLIDNSTLTVKIH